MNFVWFVKDLFLEKQPVFWGTNGLFGGLICLCSNRGFLRDTSLRRGGNGRRNKAKRLAAVVRGRLPPPVFYKNLMQFLCECVIIS